MGVESTHPYTQILFLPLNSKLIFLKVSLFIKLITIIYFIDFRVR